MDSETNANDHKKRKIYEDFKELARDVKELAFESVVELKDAAVENVVYAGNQFSAQAVEQFKEIQTLTTTSLNIYAQYQKPASQKLFFILRNGPLMMSVFIVSVPVLFLFIRQQKRRKLSQGRSRFDSTMGSSVELVNRIVPSRDRKLSTDELFLSENMNNNNGPAVNTTIGPKSNKTSIIYITWAPPLHWKEAAKRLLPKNTKPMPQSRLILQLPQGTLLIHHGKTTTTHDISKLTLAMQRPVESGIVKLIITGEPIPIERTFFSARDAAQFQHDILGLQIVGTQIRHMYHALELIHKGSMAYVGTEPVLHDSTCDNTTEIHSSTVAWEHVLRCLGNGNATIRAVALERLHAHHTTDSSGGDAASLHPDYRERRACLGHVDFFRLFVPLLPDTALPYLETLPSRLEFWLTLRKQVAESAVWVEAYVLAMQVVHRGWNPWPDLTTLRRRIAFDSNMDNMSRDRSSQNEYYEATVSRDVGCNVHSSEHIVTPGATQPSSYQAFSLVSCQAFQLPIDSTSHHFTPLVDPVEALPSLKDVICHYPELDFFISVFFPEGPKVAIVKLFVKSLPNGADPAFDTIWRRFQLGNKGLRDRKLELFVQLGPGTLSPVVWAALKAASLFLSWKRRGEPAIPVESGLERTPFPGMTMQNYMETTHFGGALQTNPNLPGNYVAVTSRVESRHMNMVFRVLYQKLEVGALPSSAIDFTYVLEGERSDELPERAMGTIRMVRMSPVSCALPVQCSSKIPPPTLQEVRATCAITPLRKVRASILQDTTPTTEVGSPINDAINRTLQSLNSSMRWNSMFSFQNVDEEVKVEVDGDSIGEHSDSSLEKDDPFKVGVDALADILDGLDIPLRRAGLPADECTTATTVKDDDWCHVAILSQLNKMDLKRYYLGAECDLKSAAVRVVESLAWRGRTFPIDTRECRIELQSGQFFQQGKDRCGNPIFYFHTMCLGPWRYNEDAVINAVLHRLEMSIHHYSKENPNVHCTIVIVLGKPFFRANRKRLHVKNKKLFGDDASTKKTTDDAESMDAHDEDDATHDTSASERETPRASWNPFKLGVNPRLQPGEDYYSHTSPKMIAKLIDTLSKHYPERLYKALCVSGKGGYTQHLNMPNSVGVMMSLSKYIPSARTRAKVICLRDIGELKDYISPDELVTFVGGNSPVHPHAFEC